MPQPPAEQNRFSEAAATWDDSPVRRERAREMAQHLRELIQEHQLSTGLDYGAGTGLTSFYLQEDLQEITLMDAAPGMIEVAQQRIDKLGISHIQARQGDWLEADFAETFDLIYILMTLHHIQDIEGILSAFHRHLSPGGWLTIADLVEEDGSFHAEYPDFDGHNGFNEQELTRQLQHTGFTNVTSRHFFELKNEQGRTYPLFLLLAQKAD